MWVADKCTLILTEGDSAKALAVSCCVTVHSFLALKLALLGFTLYDFRLYSLYYSCHEASYAA